MQILVYTCNVNLKSKNKCVYYCFTGVKQSDTANIILKNAEQPNVGVKISRTSMPESLFCLLTTK